MTTHLCSRCHQPILGDYLRGRNARGHLTGEHMHAECPAPEDDDLEIPAAPAIEAQRSQGILGRIGRWLGL